MPKQTFDNLPPAKRQVIIDLALAEFAEHPYSVASLSQIVARAGIAKGSVYQYFENKQDFYLFILDYAGQQQMELLRAQTPPDPQIGFFALLRWQMHASVQVGLAAPLLTRLMYRAVTDDLPFRDEVTRRLQTAGETHLHELLANAVVGGEINPELDLELAAFILRGVITNLHELIVRRVGVTLETAASDVSSVSGPAAEQLYDQVIHILQFGLGASVYPRRDSGGRP
jgi:AcrR family transcriptional regulator